MLLSHVEEQARRDGAAELAFDTSERAGHLIDFYTRRGYRFIEHVQWDVTNYRSVVMSRTLEPLQPLAEVFRMSPPPRTDTIARP